MVNSFSRSADLHHGGEILDGLAVGQIARLRHARHDEVIFDQPGHGFGVGRRKSKARAKPPRHAGAGDGMILDAALGDVVQKQGNVEHLAVAGQDFLHQLVGQWRFLAAVLDLFQHPDAAQQVLIHRVVVVHVELHHRHDLAEGGHELAEHAGLVHPPQDRFRIVPGGEDVDEQAVCLPVVAQFGVDQLERAGNRPHRVRMKGKIVLLRQLEDADQVDRIALEYAGIGDGEAVIVDDEIVAAGERASPRRAQAAPSCGSAPARFWRGCPPARRTGLRSGRRRPWRPGNSAS